MLSLAASSGRRQTTTAEGSQLGTELVPPPSPPPAPLDPEQSQVLGHALACASELWLELSLEERREVISHYVARHDGLTMISQASLITLELLYDADAADRRFVANRLGMHLAISVMDSRNSEDLNESDVAAWRAAEARVLSLDSDQFRAVRAIAVGYLSAWLKEIAS